MKGKMIEFHPFIPDIPVITKTMIVTAHKKYIQLKYYIQTKQCNANTISIN